ncbi:Hypothetical protein PBC10988_32690 [Planctomycetales bacterium 10988]|nr:Hypothetical protein PBC10988_32690 [Planctomycetales bacterium 10988]
MLAFVTFLQPWLLLLGLCGALATVVLHLYNNNRHRSVAWGAMQFLEIATQRHRKLFRWRDWLLLVLRCFAILLLGLALAQPYLSRSETAFDPSEPVHAVVMLDNTLSMAYETLGKDRLTRAIEKIDLYLQSLPPGSRFSIIPFVSQEGGVDQGTFHSLTEAREVLQRVTIQDQVISLAAIWQHAARLLKLEDDLPNKRVLLIGDQQRLHWPAKIDPETYPPLENLQIVRMGPSKTANAWIESFELREGLAEVGSTATFDGVLRWQGPEQRREVQVTFSIDEEVVASQSLTLVPGQSREVRFSYQFEEPVAEGEITHRAASLAISSDDLGQDDYRFLSVPVVASLPVLFVDGRGDAEESPSLGYGDSFYLRRLMAPLTTEEERGRQVLSIRRRRLDELDQTILAQVRLVVVCGVERTFGKTELLREYVEQGGQLLIAPGDRFDPIAWTNEAWREGLGILPGPLRAEPIGKTPQEAPQEVRPFFLDPRSMQKPLFQIEGESPARLTELYRSPIFFKAVEAELERGEQEIEDRLEREGRTPTDETSSDQEKVSTDSPAWLRWQAPASTANRKLTSGKSTHWKTTLLAEFSNEVPFLVETQLGRGTVVWVGTGVAGRWNTLMTFSDAVILFDRLMREMLRRTLPSFTLDAPRRFAFPLEGLDRRDFFQLVTGQESPRPLSLTALDAERSGLILSELDQRGIYWIESYPAREGRSASPASTSEVFERIPLWRIPVAVNGVAEESELNALSEEAVRARLPERTFLWREEKEPLLLEGNLILGKQYWRSMLGGVVTALGLEMLVLLLLRPRRAS